MRFYHRFIRPALMTSNLFCVSVFNDRTSIYKNSQFDFVLDQTASQRRVYDRAAIGELVKAVVDVSHKYTLFVKRDIMRQYLHMDKLGLERLLQWRDINIKSMRKAFQCLF